MSDKKEAMEYLDQLFDERKQTLEHHAKIMDERTDWLAGCTQIVSFTLNNVRFKGDHKNVFHGKSFKISMSNHTFGEDE